jgi:hypothetical protein
VLQREGLYDIMGRPMCCNGKAYVYNGKAHVL